MKASLRQAEELIRLRAYPKAQAILAEIQRQDPQNAEAEFLHGVMAWQQGDMAGAAARFQAATQLDPKEARYPMRQAAALLAANRLIDARAAADRTAALNPTDPLVLDSLGIIYSRIGAFDRGAEFARRAVAAAPRNPGFQFNLGWAEQYVGDLAAAEAAYRRAIELNPQFERAYLALVEVARQTPESNLLSKLEGLFRTVSNDPERALAIGHALAKTHEDLGDPAAALDWLERAKAPRARQLAYRPGPDREMMALAAQTWPGPGGDSGFRDARPIFVVGMPRSGTTLVDRILSSHPEVNSAGELKVFPILMKRLSGSTTRRLADTDTFRRLAGAELKDAGLDYAAAAHLAAGPSKRFVDKLPFNFLYAGLILRALPEARIVCLRRDPMDTVLSNYRQAFGTQSDFHDYTYSLDDIAAYYASFERLIDHWRRVLPPERFTEVRYEALIADQDAETRRLIDFCGLDWNDVCLKPHENASGVSTASAAQVRAPIHGGSVGRWRKWGGRMEPVKALLQSEGVAVEG